MTRFSLEANYNAHSTSMKPSITNQVTVNNVVSEDSPQTRAKDYSLPMIPTVVEPTANSSSSVSPPTDTNTPVIDEANRCKFERRFLGICRSVMCNKDLRDQVMDKNNDMILSIHDLTELIKLVTGEDEVEVVIHEPCIEIACIKIRTTPFAAKINRIVVAGMDFCIGYNRISTMLSNVYKICLTKVAF